MASPLPWLVRSVVFDVDGVLVDTEPLLEEVARMLLARLVRTAVTEVLRAKMGTPARQALVGYREHHGLTETVEELIEESGRLFLEVLGQDRAPLLPGVVDLLDRLERKGLPKAIATSSSATYVEQV